MCVYRSSGRSCRDLDYVIYLHTFMYKCVNVHVYIIRIYYIDVYIDHSDAAFVTWTVLYIYTFIYECVNVRVCIIRICFSVYMDNLDASSVTQTVSYIYTFIYECVNVHTYIIRIYHICVFTDHPDEASVTQTV